MEEIVFWTLVIGFVCCCSIGYDTVLARVRRRLRSKRGPGELPSMQGLVTAHFEAKDPVIAGKEIVRGYDSPELFYEDTLLRIQLGGSLGKSPADLH
jgi:hypothetical protein